MEGFKAAYRDPKSPLTPLTPLANNSAFNFNFGGDNSLKTSIERVKPTSKLRPIPKRYSTEFCRVRDIYEQKPCAVKIRVTNAKGVVERTPVKASPYHPLAASTRYLDLNNAAHRQLTPTQQQQQQHFKRCSPIQPRPLSPRTSVLLCKAGMSKHKPLFQREEIDLEIFRTLTLEDLMQLGIRCIEDRMAIMNAVRYATTYR